MAKTILVIGTLDTKAKELGYLQKKIETEDVESLLMDVSCKAVTASTSSIRRVSSSTAVEGHRQIRWTCPRSRSWVSPHPMEPM